MEAHAARRRCRCVGGDGGPLRSARASTRLHGGVGALDGDAAPAVGRKCVRASGARGQLRRPHGAPPHDRGAAQLAGSLRPAFGRGGGRDVTRYGGGDAALGHRPPPRRPRRVRRAAQKPLLAGQYATVGLPPQATIAVGTFELLLAVVVAMRPSPWLLVFVAAWKVATESLFVVTGAPISEFVERAGSYAAPIALVSLLLAAGRLTNRRRLLAGDYS